MFNVAMPLYFNLRDISYDNGWMSPKPSHSTRIRFFLCHRVVNLSNLVEQRVLTVQYSAGQYYSSNCYMLCAAGGQDPPEILYSPPLASAKDSSCHYKHKQQTKPSKGFPKEMKAVDAMSDRQLFLSLIIHYPCS